MGDHLIEEPDTKGIVAYKIWDVEEAKYKALATSKYDSRLATKLLIYRHCQGNMEGNQEKFYKKNNDWRLYELNIKSIQVRKGEDRVMAYACRLKAI